MRINLNDKLFQKIKAQSKKHEGVNSIQLIELILNAYLDGLKQETDANASNKLN